MRLRLATRFSATIAGILALSIISSLAALYAAWNVDQRLKQALQEARPGVHADEVQILLLKRNALVAAQLLDEHNAAWAKDLHQSQRQFQQWVSKLRSATVLPADEDDLLQRLERKWADLDAAQEKAIGLHMAGDREKARDLLLIEIRGRLSKDAYDLCEQLIASNDRHARQVVERADARIRATTWAVGISVLLTLGLGGTLMWMFVYRVVLPLRGIAADARLFRGNDGRAADDDELRCIGSHFRELMSDVTDTRSRLERSRLRLAAAEKLAAVGKLAATVAHEIRNPLTAMKMWLYDIQEKIQGDAALERKLGIISEEMTRLENIIRDFLEFSRPMELRCRPIEVNCVLQQTLDLFEQRLKDCKVRVANTASSGSPAVVADADKLKQVFINLMGNALDAMAPGGEIRIDTTVEHDAAGRRMAVVRFHDSGSGISEDVQARIFDPFFTTKEDGAGLGLCIAAQIMAHHGGLLVLESSCESGTTFAVWLPVPKELAHG